MTIYIYINGLLHIQRQLNYILKFPNSKQIFFSLELENAILARFKSLYMWCLCITQTLYIIP